MHKIPMEEDHASSIEHQRRLNPATKEVVKKEVLKWLQAGFIYAISDSPWVSLEHVVLKRGGMNVVTPQKYPRIFIIIYYIYYGYKLSQTCVFPGKLIN